MDRGFKGSYVRLYALTSLRWHTWKGLAQWPGTGRTKPVLLLTRGVLGPDLAGCEARAADETRALSEGGRDLLTRNRLENAPKLIAN